MKLTNIGIATTIIVLAVAATIWGKGLFSAFMDDTTNLDYITVHRVDSVRKEKPNTYKIYAGDYLFKVEPTRFVKYHSKLDTTVTMIDTLGQNVTQKQSIKELSLELQVRITDIIVQKKSK